MFLRGGVWFGFAEKMFMFFLAKSRKLVFSEDYCHTLYSFMNSGWSLRLLEETWYQFFFFFVGNKFMSSCIICLVSAREIFLLKSAITNVHNFRY